MGSVTEGKETNMGSKKVNLTEVIAVAYLGTLAVCAAAWAVSAWRERRKNRETTVVYVPDGYDLYPREIPPWVDRDSVVRTYLPGQRIPPDEIDRMTDAIMADPERLNRLLSDIFKGEDDA